MILNIKVGDEVTIKGREGIYKVASLNKSHVRFERKLEKQVLNACYEYPSLNESVYLLNE